MSQFLLQLHNLQTLNKPSKLQSIPSTYFSHHPNLTTFPQKPTIPSKLRLSLPPLLPSTARLCKSNGSGLDFDVLSQPEERGGKPHRRANGIFWIILANIGIYLADHVFQVIEAAQASTALSGSFGRNLLMNVNHIAHLSGALVGVFSGMDYQQGSF